MTPIDVVFLFSNNNLIFFTSQFFSPLDSVIDPHNLLHVKNVSIFFITFFWLFLALMQTFIPTGRTEHGFFLNDKCEKRPFMFSVDF